MTEQVRNDEPRPRLSTFTAIVRVMRTDEDFVEVNSLAFQEVEQQALWAFEFLAWKHARAEPILVRDHDQAIPVLDEQSQSRDEARLEADLTGTAPSRLPASPTGISRSVLFSSPDGPPGSPRSRYWGGLPENGVPVDRRT